MINSFDRKNLPKNRIARIVIGILLVIGGVFGFLPVLGFWMVPLGLLVLSIDVAIARRWRRRLEVWWADLRSDRKELRQLKRARKRVIEDENPKPEGGESSGDERL